MNFFARWHLLRQKRRYHRIAGGDQENACVCLDFVSFFPAKYALSFEFSLLYTTMKGVWVFLILLAVRLLSVFFVKTSYVPDEFWQSLEVAHKIVYG